MDALRRRRAHAVSDYALREGVLLDTMQRDARRLAPPSPRRLAAQRRAPGRAMRRGPGALGARRARSPLAAVRRDGRRSTASTRTAASYLEAGALLANVGLSSRTAQHHKHCYYVIRNSERLLGLHRPRDRDDRPDRSLPPQERAEAEPPRVRRARPDDQAVVRRAAPACCGWPSASTAATTARSDTADAKVGSGGVTIIAEPARPRDRPASSCTPRTSASTCSAGRWAVRSRSCRRRTSMPEAPSLASSRSGVVQLVEHRPLEPDVAGSSPAPRALFHKDGCATIGLHDIPRHRVSSHERTMVGRLPSLTERCRDRDPRSIAHEANGLDEYLCEAEMLAELGYVSFALDYHGGGAPPDFADAQAPNRRLVGRR